ncbi:hypothetical protein SLS62_011104 [Diatrype stigma]|uniref:Fucose-specific lectin n=1 Tax=Diatrype stigma TaxID=117547 RepID=A0AAN9YEM9_9PEZI
MDDHDDPRSKQLAAMSYEASPTDYSTLEVDDQRLPELDSSPPTASNYPEVVPYTPVHPGAKQAETSRSGSTAQPTLCGLRKRKFWIVAAISVLVIAGIIAGTVGGVVSSRKNHHESSIESPDATSSGLPRENGGPEATAILPTTRISSANFVDAYGNDNYLVVYQLNNHAIYLSAWNSSHQQWVVSPLLDGTIRDSLDEIRLGTALSIDVYRHSDEVSGSIPYHRDYLRHNAPGRQLIVATDHLHVAQQKRDVHIYWQNASDTVRSIMYSSNITTDKPVAPGKWIEKYRREDFTTAGSGESIVSYAKQCDSCVPWTYYFCQTSAGRLSGAYRTPTADAGAPGWEFVDFVNGIGLPAANTSLAVAAAAATDASGQSISLFFQSSAGVLTQIVYDGASGYRQASLDRGDLRARGSIVAFSTGANDTGLALAADGALGFQVLTVGRDETSPGIFSTYFREGAWTAGDKVEALGNCAARGSMAVNQGRRVYCVQDTSGSDGEVEIIEYAWGGDEKADNTDYTNYRVIGAVGTKT